MTDERRKLARELLAAATPGPWYFDEYGCCYSDSGVNKPVLEPQDCSLVRVSDEDSKLIAAAPDLLREALDELDRRES